MEKQNQVKRLATDEDVYVLAQSDARIDKERGMRSPSACAAMSIGYMHFKARRSRATSC